MKKIEGGMITRNWEVKIKLGEETKGVSLIEKEKWGSDREDQSWV